MIHRMINLSTRGYLNFVTTAQKEFFLIATNVLLHDTISSIHLADIKTM